MAGRGTPRQGIRIEPDLWAEFGQAVEVAEPLPGQKNRPERPEVIRAFIRWYIGERKAKLPPRPATRSAGARTRRPDEEETP